VRQFGTVERSGHVGPEIVEPSRFGPEQLTIALSQAGRQLGVMRARPGSGSEFNECDFGKLSFLW